MEVGESMRRSLRLGSSKIWGGEDAFTKSSKEEDDLESLKWAALEKLPTYNRLHKGLLHLEEGTKEVDIENLGPQQRRELLQRLVSVTEEAHQRLLLKFKDRIDSVGIELPTIEVRYENLRIEAEAYVGNRGTPTFLNFFLNANGHQMEEFVPQRTATYISQHDLHLPEMTVRETLEFS